MRVAAIDIGTNTILTLIADVEASSLKVLRDEHAIARLGGEVDTMHMISPQALERAVGILKHHLSIAEELNVDRVIACGTSALRLARNADEVLTVFRREVGVDVEVISGEREAELTYLGAVSQFYSPDRTEDFLVVDIGGGSTELTSGTGLTVRSRVSLEIGSVRITERFLATAPPTTRQIQEARSFIQESLERIARIPAVRRTLGVAGTLTTLAALDLGLTKFDPARVGGHILTVQSIQKHLNRLSRMTTKEIAALPQIVRGREDIILAGVLILDTLLRHMGLSEITVSERGLRYGMAMTAVR